MRRQRFSIVVVLALVGCHRDETTRMAVPVAKSESDLEWQVEVTSTEYRKSVERLNDDRSQEAFAESDRRKAAFDAALDRLMIPYRDRLLKAARLFKDDLWQIESDTLGCRRALKARKIDAPLIAEILDGGIWLGERAHYGKKPSFGEYCFLYGMWRVNGLDHDAAIKKLDDLKKL